MSDETTEGSSSDAGDDSFDEYADDAVDDVADEFPHEFPDEGADLSPEELPDAVSGAAGDPPRPSQLARRMVWAPRTRVAVASLALVAMMFLFVFPTRSYLAQKRQVGQAAHAVKVLKAQNEVLARQAERLKTPSEIERLAREQFNMVLPGEQAYNVVETPASPTVTTTTTVP
jgi:cell division protein FtsB